MEETDLSSNMKLGLDLGLGLTKYEPKIDSSKKNKRVFFLDLSIPCHPSDLDHAGYSSSSCMDILQEPKKQTTKNGLFSSGVGCKEDDGMDYPNCSRKKLRLRKDQTTLLEDSFRQHSTLSMAHIQALAEKLSLKPRQVEVWFQNRRARTKLKQTEKDCEFLKKKLERLREENQHLLNQLLELGSAAKIEKVPSPLLHTSAAPTAPSSVLEQLFYHMPKESAIYRTCASCEKLLKSGGGKKEAAAAVDAATKVIGED